MERKPPATGQSYFDATETLAHRVRHVFAVIRSIVARTSARRSEDVQDYAAHLDGRIEAFARAQMGLILHPTGDLELEDLLRDELVAQLAEEGAQFTLDGPAVILPVRVAEVMTLVFHELATNAIKFGALSGAGGKLDVSWSLADGPQPHVRLEWIEHGVAGVREQGEGFGLELIKRQAPYEIGGAVELEFTPEGVHCVMTFPVARGQESNP